jgi:hypothetical protein
MDHHDDFAFEPVPGLPARPPQGERVLWQGRPDALALANDALALKWVAGWFALIALWRGGAAASAGGLEMGLAYGLPYIFVGVVACAILYAIAWSQARATVYTLTTARVAMRVGAALTVTLNIPFRQIAQADLRLIGRRGLGSIVMTTSGADRLSYVMCWPHVRPWRMSHTQPALRCIPDAARVAKLMAEAVEVRMNEPVVARAQAHGAAPHAVAAE